VLQSFKLITYYDDKFPLSEPQRASLTVFSLQLRTIREGLNHVELPKSVRCLRVSVPLKLPRGLYQRPSKRCGEQLVNINITYFMVTRQPADGADPIGRISRVMLP
jgi:hypothetical protein